MMKPQLITAAMLILPLAVQADQIARKKSAAERTPKSARKIAAEPQQKPGWLVLPQQTSSPKLGKVVTRSAFPISGKREPRTAADFKVLRKRLGYDPRDLWRSFGVEKKEFLLGEPILVRFEIKLAGKGKRGRDDWIYFSNRNETFLVLLRDEKGNWIADRYHPREFYFGGGSVIDETFNQKEPEIHWLPIQQYRSITRPGTYDVFCLKLSRDTESPSSPLLAVIPKEVIRQAPNHAFAKIDFATDYAHFSITIDRGSDADRTRMIQFWANVVAQDKKRSPHRGKANATVRSWVHCLQNDFLPSLHSWLQDYRDEEKFPFALISLSDKNDGWEGEPLTRMSAAKVIPKMIDDLTAKDARVRSTAGFHLRQWTGLAFGHNWQGHKSDRPTLEEAGAIQEQWRKWWKEDEAGFSTHAVQQADSRKGPSGTPSP